MEISSRSGIMILFATIAVCTLVLFPLLQYVAERDPQLSAYDDDWNDILNVNLKGPFICSQEAIKLMK